MLDTSRLIETPEGVHLQLSPAGPVVRSLAWVIDLAIRGAALMAVGMVIAFLGDFGIGMYLLIAFLLEWLYPVAFEVYNHGATPGKRALGLKTVQDNGVPVGFSASLIRNLLRGVDFLPVAYGFGLVSMLINRDFKRLGDLAAGTVVVYDATLLSAVDPPNAEPMPLPVALGPSEQQAITDFAERSRDLSPERAAELADILQPLTGARSEAGLARLQRYASWLHGQR